MKKEEREKVDALATRYRERLEKRVAEGLDLPGEGERKGRLPAGVNEKNREAYVALRDQLKQLKELRKGSVTKLREIIEAMDNLRDVRKPKKAAKKKS